MTSAAAKICRSLSGASRSNSNASAIRRAPGSRRGGHDGQPVYDVLIVGGGQSGITIAFRLLRERVTNIRVLDRSTEGREGPWINFARMHTLRTPKEVIGPELGIPSLSARAWYEARFGEKAWDELGKIPRELWHDYSAGCAALVGIDVTHEAEVTDIEPIADGLFAVTAMIGGKPQTLFARNVVLATGIEGTGRWIVPDIIADSAAARSLRAYVRDRSILPRLPARRDRRDRRRRVGLRQRRDRARTRRRSGRPLLPATKAARRQSKPLDRIRRLSSPFRRSRRRHEVAFHEDHLRHESAAAAGCLRALRPLSQFYTPSRQPAQERETRRRRHSAERRRRRHRAPTSSLSGRDSRSILRRGRNSAASAPHIARWSDRYRPPAGEEHPTARRLSRTCRAPSSSPRRSRDRRRI